ncbi:PIN domain-containing protein [Burkholderia gladioli]|uniref:PIN domain-containing protein n=1 Tax=Burkholderia gladioli TaxID=28095 RepID=UPI00163ED667|nr:PIN domain-containing protein [Burkholderia gladioli]
MDQSIHDQILAGEITALSIDTSVFEKNGLALESGLLAQLVQFRGSDIALIIPNTVANEVKRHVARNATDATKALRNALQTVARHQAVSAAHQTQLDALAGDAIKDDEERARSRFDDWAARVGVEVIDAADFASIGEVMRRYEQGEPPFAATGDKKHEFPDAVALSTLEGWAEAKNTRILAVAQDKDWQQYGAQSGRVVVVDDLADALAAMQRLAAVADPSIRLAAQFAAGDAIGLRRAVLEAARYQVDQFRFDVEADSQFSVEEEDVETFVDDISLDIPDATGTTLDTVSHSDGQAVIRVCGTAIISVNVSFSFQKWDGIDREYMDMGSTKLSETAEVEFAALVTVDTDEGLAIDDVEILGATHGLYFNDIEPDWMSDPDNYDTYEQE